MPRHGIKNCRKARVHRDVHVDTKKCSAKKSKHAGVHVRLSQKLGFARCCRATPQHLNGTQLLVARPYFGHRLGHIREVNETKLADVVCVCECVCVRALLRCE